jgi:NAD(P)H-flavin reductase/ferredoxin
MNVRPADPGVHTATINGRKVRVQPKETLLHAALREGIAFPHSCRVGGCATCKCRLVEGEVKELTEATYLLSDDELDARTILACQSVPQSDVRIEVALTDAPRRVAHGHVTAKEPMTADIVRLRVQLDGPLDYQPGQFAELGLASLPTITRSYSFATPPQSNGQLTFFVRKVPGGAFSTRVVDGDVVGEAITVEGPSGAFVLRPGQLPLILVAGGSGLAPVLAILAAAVDAGDTRPATLLFGARTQADLYAQAEIDAIAKAWRGPFTFVPVLSDAAADATWAGARGLVTDHLAAHVVAGAHAYLCGPPGMVDAAATALRARGVAARDIHADRFTTRKERVAEAPAPQADARVAGPLDYLKYFLFHGIGAYAVWGILAGGSATYNGLLGIILAYMLGDALLGDDTSTPRFTRPGVLTAQLWMALPLLCLIVFCALWMVAPGDPLGFGAWATTLTGYDLLAARAATTFGEHVAAGVITGLMIGLVGTIPAHELTHRTWDPISMTIGRWLLAFSFDTIFSIEHVFGHHRYVSTIDDPATAPRGRSVYTHVVASTIKGNVSAWKIEARRLRRKGLAVWGWRNVFLRGQAMSALLLAVAYAIGGWTALGYFVACGLWGKALLEIVNYMEHYGMVRDPAVPVQPRHSWNTNRRISSWAMFNLTRHSHHHAQGEVAYQDLRPMPEAPMMINGYLTTILVTLVPPLWHALMTPKVLAWDRDYATDDEKILAARANVRSGMRGFQQAGGAAAK